MKPVLLSTETIEDLIPFINGHSLTFRYSEGKCVRIIGKDNDELVLKVDLTYDDDDLSGIEIESAHVRIPNDVNPKIHTCVPGIGQFRYLRESSRLKSVDAALSLYVVDKEYESGMHREYRYDDDGHLIQVVQNGESLRESTYRDDLLVFEKRGLTEIKYVYNDSRLIKGIILKEAKKITCWRAFEYADTRLAREFIIHPADGKWQLRSLHIHDFALEDIGKLSVTDCVARYFYDRWGRLVMKLKIEDESVKQTGFRPGLSLEAMRTSTNMELRNWELYVLDPNGRCGIAYRKRNGRSIVNQCFQYNSNGFLKTIETAPDSHFDGICLLSLKHLTCNDVCF